MSMIIDGTNGLTFNNATTQASAGNVLQVVQGTVAGKITTSSTSFVTTGLAANITPKFSNSKILATVTLVGCFTVASNRELSATIYRDATNIAPTGTSSNKALGWLYNPSAGTGGNLTFSYIDSPATTSSTAYTVYFASAGGGVVDINENSFTSTIVLQEIAG
jgi:hypothetical protein